MPEKMTKNSSGGYTVTGPHGTHAKNTTKEKAEAQVRLLNAIDHGFEPNKRGNFSSRTEATDEMMQTMANESKKTQYAEGSPTEERAESPAKERREQRAMAKGSTRGNRSGGELGEFHAKRSKI